MSVFDKMHKSGCGQDLRSDGKSDVRNKAHHGGCVNTEKSMENDNLPFVYEKFYLKKNPNKNMLLAIFFFICV